jgi:nitrate/nitrite transporter NarK
VRMDTLLRDLGTAEADADRNAGFIAGSTWAIRAGGWCSDRMSGFRVCQFVYNEHAS